MLDFPNLMLKFTLFMKTSAILISKLPFWVPVLINWTPKLIPWITKIDCFSHRLENLDSNVKNLTQHLTQQQAFNEQTGTKLVALDENTGRQFLSYSANI